jgi:hypothetical protein
MTQNTVQSSYSRYMTAGAAGAAASMHGWDADTKQAAGNIPFGYAVSKNATQDGVVAGGTLFTGVAIRDITLVHTTPDRYESGDNVGVLTQGDIWVLVEEAVVAQTQAKYDTSTGQLGKAAGTAISGAYWMTSADAGALAVLRLATGAVDVTT